MKQKDLRCFDCEHPVSEIFCGLPRPYRERLEREKSLYEYLPGQIIFHEGNQPSYL
jgi:hypothetical protein